MSHNIKGFLSSIIVHLFVAISFIYAYDNIKINKEEKVKKVVIDLNMIEEITKLKQVTTKKEVVQKQDVSKKIEKQTVQKKKKRKNKPIKKILTKKKIQSKVVKKILKKEEKIQPQKITKANAETKQTTKKTLAKKKSIVSETKKIQSDKNYTRKYMKNNLSYIIKAIKKYRKYPYNAKKMGFEGKCILSCVYTKNGVVKDIKIKKSSGYEILDKNSIQILRLASKEFKAPTQNIELHIPFNYYLN